MQGKSVEWLYIGGGTPLTMSVPELDVLFGTLYELNLINQDTYISLESRPEVITQKKIDLLKRYNVSRVSMGVESFDEKTVVSMGRIRKGLNYYDIVTKAVKMIREAEIKYFNLDFIYSHPLDEIETVLDSISKALDFMPDSLSIYPLGLPFQRTTIEKDVIEGRDIKSLDFRLRCFTLINETLKKNGYHMVSDSIWSRNKMFSHKRVHNNKGIVNFWNQTCMLPFGLWIPIGVGSIGFLENYGPIQNTYSITQYIELIENGNLGMVKGTQHNLEELMRSEMVISVLHRVIDLARFIDKYHVHPTEVFPIEFSLLKEMGLIEESDSEIRLTEQAIPISQGIARFFVSKEVESKYRETEKHRIDYKIYNISYKHLV
jgi:oxygen-independent coproporphyrinogen-3 oxidase